MLSVVLHVLAVVAFVIAVFIGFDWVTSDKWPGWIALGLALFAAAHIPWTTVYPRRQP